ncbi:hypothetical protein ACWEQL_00620 [Kitasatospora sp. NPDC004240]
MSESSLSAGRINREGMCSAYGHQPRTIDAWVRLLNFPAPGDDGRWDAEQVDAWVKANRPQSWPAKTAEMQELASVEAADEEPGEREDEVLLPTKTALAAHFGVSLSAVNAWTKVDGFPAGTEGGWPAGKVEAWVKENRAHVWAELTGAAAKVVIAPPQGDPKDLYDIGGYGEILGNATRGRPLSRSTISSYKSLGHLEPPDRKPGDRKRPEVFEPMWFLETITRHVYGRRGPGRVRAGRTRRKSS